MNEALKWFVPGARVAIRDGYGSGYCEAFIDRVYKERQFALEAALSMAVSEKS